MALIDSLAGIASNLGLGKLAPANTDAISGSIAQYQKAGRQASVARAANRDARVKGGDHFSEATANYGEKITAARELGRTRQADRLQDQGLAAAQVSKNFREARGITDMATKMDGTKLTPEQLAEFRKSNNQDIVGYQKSQKDAARQLRGHAKDYYFSGDLGTNAMRWGATAGAYGALAVGTRTLTGGSATTNNQGQRDIAGIPFI